MKLFFEAGNSFVDVTKAQYIHVDSKGREMQKLY